MDHSDFWDSLVQNRHRSEFSFFSTASGMSESHIDIRSSQSAFGLWAYAIWYLFYRRYLNQFERSDPPFAFSYGQLRAFRDLIKTYNEHVYAPRLNAFKQGWDSAKMVSRVARVCKVRKSCFCKHCSDVYDNNDLLKSCVAKIVGDREAAWLKQCEYRNWLNEIKYCVSTSILVK